MTSSDPPPTAAPMVPMLQAFEFVYPDGFLFFDRSGAMGKRLRDLIPGLQLKSATSDQRDFHLPDSSLEILFGIAVSQIRSLVLSDEQFPSLATRFLELASETFELSSLNEFRFRIVYGRPCESHEEAESLMWPLVAQDVKEKLQTISVASRWTGLQAEFQMGDLACVSRIAILDLAPNRSYGIERSPVPHITFQVDLRGVAPVPLADFDAEAFMRNIKETQSKELLKKLAPHLGLA